MGGGAMLSAGQRLGNYILREPIGKGGFAVVWKAVHHERVQRVVAIKIATDPEFRRQLTREGTLPEIDHPNVAPILDSDTRSADVPYIVTPYYAGGSLSELIDAHPKGLPTKRVRTLLTEILAGLAAAHARGIVHRDIKPSNILLDDGGRAVIADFGLSAAAGGGDALRSVMQSMSIAGASDLAGTLAYMAPEVREGRPATRESDIFSLGVVLFEMLTGRRPAGLEHTNEVRPELGGDDVPWFMIYVDTCRPAAARPSAADLLAQLTASPTVWTAARGKARGKATATKLDTGALFGATSAAGAEVNDEQSAWDRTLREDRLEAYRSYLKQFPRGRHKDAARRRIDALEASGARPITGEDEEARWRHATSIDSVGAYEAYLHESKIQRYASDARQRIYALRHPDESRAVQGLRKRPTAGACARFLRDYPKSEYCAEVEGLRARSQAGRTSRWLFVLAPPLWALLAVPVSVPASVVAALAICNPERNHFWPLMWVTYFIPVVPLVLILSACFNRSLLGLDEKRRSRWFFALLLHFGVGLTAFHTNDLYRRGEELVGDDTMKALVKPANIAAERWVMPALERWQESNPKFEARLFVETYYRGYFALLFAVPFSFLFAWMWAVQRGRRLRRSAQDAPPTANQNTAR